MAATIKPGKLAANTPVRTPTMGTEVIGDRRCQEPPAQDVEAIEHHDEAVQPDDSDLESLVHSSMRAPALSARVSLFICFHYCPNVS